MTTWGMGNFQIFFNKSIQKAMPGAYLASTRHTKAII
jgi:hypothetical protein